ncbi:MAG: cytochrome C [Magnetococcales bacterium]|nr:cytochrome C [Magnetococcales bacterium]
MAETASKASVRQMGFRAWGISAGAFLLAHVFTLSSAEAVPSYARQTGQNCAACHVGSYGPQLTPYGIKFKLEGYTDTDGKSGHVPLSAMALGTWTHTKADQPGGAAIRFDPNDNAALQEVSVFLAGALSEHVGSFIQAGYSGIERRVSMDNMDVRYANTLAINDKELLWGVTLNNNPTIQDPFNTLPAWRFPYEGSELAPTPAASPMIAGLFEHNVLGLTGYVLWDHALYAEFGAYETLPHNTLSGLNLEDGGRLVHPAPYGRLAYFKDMKKMAFSLGTFAMSASLLPDRQSGPTDGYRDIGVDASFQYLGTREHVFNLYGSYIHERRNLGASTLNPGSTTLDRADLTASYHFDQTYGITLNLFEMHGDADIDSTGALTSKPDSKGLTIQADWTPFGKEGSWQEPWANVRFGLQYTLYREFDGVRHDDTTGFDASDNNTVFAFIWTSI